MNHDNLLAKFEETKKAHMDSLKMLSMEMAPIVDNFIKNKDFENGATYLYDNYPDCSSRMIQLHRIIVAQEDK